MSLASSSQAATASPFGAATFVTIRDGLPPVVGFTRSTPSGGGTWPFDVGASLGMAGTSGDVSGPPVLPAAQQRAEQDAIKAAFDHIDLGAYDAARELMNQVLAKNKRSAAAVHALGYADLSEGNYAKAEQLFLRAHAMNATVGYDNDARNARILQSSDEQVLAHARAMIGSASTRGEGIRLLIVLTDRSHGYSPAHMLLGDSLLAEGDVLNSMMQYNAAIGAAGVGELSQLESRLARLAERHDRSGFVRQLVGKVQMRQGRFGTALNTLRMARAGMDDTTGIDPDVAKAYVGIGRQFLKSGDVAQALGSLKQARAYDPYSREVKVAYAEGLAARAAKRAQQRAYADATADYKELANLLRGISGVDRLREGAAHRAFMVGKSIQARRVAAGGEIDAELTAYQAAYDLDSSNTTYKRRLADTRNALGDQYLAAGRLKEAAYAYRRAWKLFTNDQTYKSSAIAAFRAWGEAEAANQNWTPAIDAFREAYLIDTSDAAVKLLLANAYNQRGLDHMSWERYGNAAGDFREALRLFPDNAEYQANYNLVSAWLEN